MKHLILGTAGHVDHGKTTLVKALTGVDTDRLPEEKARGMTIELGFTHLELPSGITLGLVDMPGHEKFIKHMAAGAGGVDIAILVVAADEGIMRQTQEHMEILELLGIDKAVVAITKSDLADPEWLDMVREEIASKLAGTLLEGSSIVAVSAMTGSGIDELISELDKVAEEATERSREPAARIYIDRVFTMTGHGTVLTGTLLGDAIGQDDKLQLLPSGSIVRIKQLEVHDKPVLRAERGQRAALNVSSSNKEEIERGMALASPGWLEATELIDVEAVLAAGAEPITHNERLRLHIGTSEVICRARVPKDQPSGRMLMQLETEEPVFPVRGDRFILRTYSPSATVAGGRVLCNMPPRRKVGSEKETASLHKLASNDRNEALNELIMTVSRAECGSDCIWPVEEALLTRRAYMLTEDFDAAFKYGEADGAVVMLENEGNTFFLDCKSYNDALTRLKALLADFHLQYPLRKGMPKEEIRQKLMPKADKKHASALFARISAAGEVSSSVDLLWLSGHSAILTEEQKRTAGAMEAAFKKDLLSPPDLVGAISAAGKGASQIADYLVGEGILVKVSSEVAFHKDAVEAALKEASKFEGQFTAAMLRDALGTSRKYAIAMLEWMDSQEYTQRSGDNRTLRPQYKGKK